MDILENSKCFSFTSPLTRGISKALFLEGRRGPGERKLLSGSTRSSSVGNLPAALDWIKDHYISNHSLPRQPSPIAMAPLFELKIRGSENLKALSAALHFLRTVGKDLQIEVSPENLVLRALNDPKTAYASVEFASGFFDRGSLLLHKSALKQAFGSAASQTQSGIDLDSFSCKLAVKHFCSLTKSFRNVSMLALRAESTEERGYELIVELHSSNGIVRTHRFKYSDCDVISAVFDESGSCSLGAMCKIFSNLLEHMHHAPEVFLSATPTSFKVQSYHRAVPMVLTDASRHLETDLSVDVSDFDFYNFGDLQLEQPSTQTQQEQEQEQADGDGNGYPKPLREVIVSRREWRALLSFSDNVNCDDVTIFFAQHGKPIKFSMQHEFIVGTLIMTTIELNRKIAAEAELAGNAQLSQQPSQAKTKRGLKAKAVNESASANAATQSQQYHIGTAPSSSAGTSRPPKWHAQSMEVEEANADEQEQEMLPAMEGFVVEGSAAPARKGRASSSSSSRASPSPLHGRAAMAARVNATRSPSPASRSAMQQAAKSTKERSPTTTTIRKGVILDDDDEDEDEEEEDGEEEEEEEKRTCGGKSGESQKKRFKRLSRTGDTAKALLGLKTGTGVMEFDHSGESATPTL